MTRIYLALLIITQTLLMVVSARVADKSLTTGPESEENIPRKDTTSRKTDTSVPEVRIQNGQPLQTPPSFLVAIAESGSDPFCTATMITPRTVLTAAHCHRGVNFLSEVVLGLSNVTYENRRHYYNDSEVDIIPFNMSHFVTHPEFDEKTLANDIAIIQLPWPVKPKFRPISTASLPEKEYKEDLTAFGWGKKNSRENGSDLLRMAIGRYVDNDKCTEDYGKNRIQDYDLCALFYNDSSKTSLAGVAPGDSGGPLVMKGAFGPVQIGVLSSVVQVPDQPEDSQWTNFSIPQIYARVAKYYDFIWGNAL